MTELTEAQLREREMRKAFSLGYNTGMRLSRRERIATAVLGGLAAYNGEIAGTKLEEFGLTRPVMAAVWATQWADALIAELDKGAAK